jgi:hypothetical protein
MAAVSLAACMSSARADEVTIAGSSLGAFGANPFSVTAIDSTGNITFHAAPSFNVTTFGGVGTVNPNIGTFDVGSVSPGQNLTPQTFSVQLTFTLPVVINGGPQAQFSSVVTGSITNDPNVGGPYVDFGPTGVGSQGVTQHFTFVNSQYKGAFDLTINDLALNSNTLNQQLEAHISGAQQSLVPEPGSLALILPGLAPFGFALRRRRRSSK